MNGANGSALISTLLMVAVLTIIVTAFMQSMAVERRTASSYKNKLLAELASEAGAAAAINLVAEIFSTYPDSATGWYSFSGTLSTEGTVFYYRAKNGSNDAALPSEANPQVFARPLISGSVQTSLANGAAATQLSTLTQASSFGENLTTLNSVNFNHNGMITGAYAGNAQRAFRAKWVNILEDPSQAEDFTINPATGRARNGPISRYAFWVDDNSFRLNVNEAGSNPRGSNSVGRYPSEIAMQGLLNAIGVQVSANAVTTLRDSLDNDRFSFPSQINYASDSSGTDFDLLKFYLTDNSSSLNLSRGGMKRINLNTVVKDIPVDGSPSSTAPPNSDEGDYQIGVRRQLDRIIAAISNPYGIVSGTTPGQQTPAFGQRFYSYQLSPAGLNAETATNNHAQQYMQRIAANIRDYIDEDSQPTIVENSNGFPVRQPARPLSAIGFDVAANTVGDNEIAAFGKEALPGMHEYAFRVSLYSFNPSGAPAGATFAQYDMAIDHYFEFLNPWDQYIPLAALSPAGDGSDVFLKVYNQFAWDTSGGDNIPPGRPFEIALSDFVDGSGNIFQGFPAGGITVFTTDDAPSSGLVGAANVANVFRPNPATIQRLNSQELRRYTGTTRRISGSRFRINPVLGTNGGRAGTGASDYDTHMLLGNPYGILESFSALPIPFDLSVNNEDNNRLAPNNNFFFRGGSLFGNSGAVSQTGDPRSINEQLRIQRYRTGGDSDQTRFYSSNLNNNAVPASSSFMRPNTNFVTMINWPDYSPDPVSSATNAPGTIANQKMQSIGELGNIYDPSRRLLSGNTTGASFARGGGLTFRMGQSDKFAANPPFTRANQWDGNPLSVSRNRAAWRLADIFSTRDYTGIENLVMPGVLNINGINRDGGAAFRALIDGLQFAVPGAGGQVNVTNLLQALNTRLSAANPNPFWERGEISELPLFNSGTGLSGADMSKVVDRGREELIRRIIELISTKGNVFTVYCMGESVSVGQSGLRVLATNRRRVTFEIVPVYDSPLPADDAFIPTFDSNGVATLSSSNQERFRTPDRFVFKVISTDSL